MIYSKMNIWLIDGIKIWVKIYVMILFCVINTMIQSYSELIHCSISKDFSILTCELIAQVFDFTLQILELFIVINFNLLLILIFLIQWFKVDQLNFFNILTCELFAHVFCSCILAFKSIITISVQIVITFKCN